MSDSETLKQAAGEHAASWVESGMVVGLGTGSTAIHAIKRIAARLYEGSLSQVVGIPTSRASEMAAMELGIQLGTLADYPVIDVTIDGADEVDGDFNLIKGGGAALLHEKVVAQASLREVIVVDAEKCSEVLGTKFAVPVEVLAFAWRPEADYLDDMGAEVRLRRNAESDPVVTDEGNWILDAMFGPIADVERLSNALDRRAAVMAHGLFLGLATDLVVAGPNGIEHRTSP
ncbi:MAG: ribose-5-phosphate isomerase RpiA [Acidimicrobiia bacterium]|nr:ribose-5-phosphate isomerase RpiA [Acidimicrobiia bacterium]